MKIDGYTRMAAVIAHPIRHSISPFIHNLAYELTATNAAYLAWDIAEEDLESTISQIRKLDMILSLIHISDFVNQVNWDLVSQNKESIAYIRSLIALKTSLPVLGLESYDKIYQQVFIQSATDISGLVIYELTGDKKYLVIFNASGLPYYLQNSNKMKLMVGNSRHKRCLLYTSRCV